MCGGGAYLFASENNTALEVKNQKILLQIKELQAEFESEDSLKKRNQIQSQIDTLKKQYAENALLLQNQNPEKSSGNVSQKSTTNTDSKPSNQSKKPEKVAQKTTQTFKQKQSGSFISIGGGVFAQTASISFSPSPLYYDSDLIASGGVFLAKGGYQSMWASWIGGRAYISGGYIGGGFLSANIDLLLQIPIGGIALGVYGGVGGGLLWGNITYEASYLTKTYQFTPKRIGVVDIPFGVALAFGHSRFELGALVISGSMDNNSTQYGIRTNYETSLVATTLSYQYTF